MALLDRMFSQQQQFLMKMEEEARAQSVVAAIATERNRQYEEQIDRRPRKKK